MSKTIFITGSTDGIGREAAMAFAKLGHNVILHGRSGEKSTRVQAEVEAVSTGGSVTAFVRDLSRMEEVKTLAADVSAANPVIDVLMNNAGVFAGASEKTVDGLDARFAVNTIAPYLLTQALLPKMPATGRVINVSSAAQAPVHLEALRGQGDLSDGDAYAQSKLALTAWTFALAKTSAGQGPVMVAVNPGSMLATKMVKDAFGVHGADIQIGAKVLVDAALSDAFAGATGKYYDNDNRRFAPAHRDAEDESKAAAVTAVVDDIAAAFR